MPEQEDLSSTRERLLDAAIAYVAEHGFADLSLRKLGTSIGTSHRMLIYYFGSKAGLLLEVVRAVEQRELAALARLDVEEDLDEAEVMRRMWKRFSDPRMWPQERLFFDVYARSLAGQSPRADEFLDEVIQSWLTPVAAHLAERRGATMAEARAEARVRLAVTRGLLLDLLASGDRAGVTRAHEWFVRVCELAAAEH
jgi:AcrR family transcriptional regulator